ncbi:MAG TPA: hypothetical protein VMG60_06690 [Burkholderiaceae bacterium]|nr:hypothetical protein [Burkholderiaceae bacterium]
MVLAERALAGMLFCFLASLAQASDRPYLVATDAVADEDDYDVAGIESWLESSQKYQEFRFEPEYNFDPSNAVRVELAIARDRRFDQSVRSRGVELEYKHLFTDLQRSGYGSGVIAGLDWDDRSAAVGGEEGGPEHTWSLDIVALTTLRPTPDTLVHFNLGAVKESGQGAHARWAVAAEHEIIRRTTLFAEAGGSAGEERLIHGGLRHWIRRERFAVDLTVGRRYLAPADRTFITIGIALQDM